MSRYRCTECEDMFEHTFMCALHHIETKHEKFEHEGLQRTIHIKQNKPA